MSQPAGWDLWGRDLADYRCRYPEMQVLAALPPGTILDGELVLLSQGVPDLEAILARHQLSHPAVANPTVDPVQSPGKKKSPRKSPSRRSA